MTDLFKNCAMATRGKNFGMNYERKKSPDLERSSKNRNAPNELPTNNMSSCDV